MLARTGGNEFGILVGLKRGIEDALAAAERIQDVMTAPFRLSDLEIKVECAIGVTLMDGVQDPEELFRHAQFAVKQAKAAGKPQVYEPREASAARRRFSIETELRRALDKDQLKLFYQPLISLKTGEVTGFEALARWHHEDRGEISPTEFIPVAEESGLILTLGRWAMDKAISTLADWDRQAGEVLPCYVGVNLSAIQIARDDIAAMASSALRANGLAGQRLTVELTESSIVQDPTRATRVFEALKALDATVAMDDFGTGYSSLAYLQRLPIDVLKIDRSFVTGMMNDPEFGGDRSRGAEPCRGAWHVDHRRGHRDGRTGDDARRLGLRERAGLLFRQAARGRRGACLFQVAAALSEAATQAVVAARQNHVELGRNEPQARWLAQGDC